jgi:hypothetical protein
MGSFSYKPGPLNGKPCSLVDVFQLPKTMQMVESKELIFISLEYGLSLVETCGVATRTKGHEVRTKGHEVLKVHCV